MKILKRIFITILVILGGIGVWYGIYHEHIHRFPSILPAYYSKEMCSCLYVLKRPEKFCHTYARQYIKIKEYKHNEKEKSVQITGLGRTEKAVFVSERFGCVLK